MLANVVSYEEDVRSVFGKVSLGEADAGIVYSSDVVADKKNTVRTIAIPDMLNTLATYPIAPLNDSRNSALSKQFIDFVMSKEGQGALRTIRLIIAKEVKHSPCATGVVAHDCAVQSRHAREDINR